MNIDPRTHVSDIAVEHPSTIPVLERLGIEYCCGGAIPLDTACRDRSLETTTVLADLQATVDRGRSSSGESWERRPLPELVDHILVTYHEPLRRDLQVLDQLVTKVAGRHGDRHPEMLPALAATFGRLQDELLAHMRDEEVVCFPHIRGLAEGRRSSKFDVRRMLPQLVREHLKAAEGLRFIRGLTNDFIPPAGACVSFRALFAALEDLERNLHRHVHLENNVLFPRAAAVETQLAQTTTAEGETCCVPGSSSGSVS